MRDSIKCSECGSNLEPIYHSLNSVLNFEQWSAVRAGDYRCPNLECLGIAKIDPDDLVKSGHRCFWKKDLNKHKLLLKEE